MYFLISVFDNLFIKLKKAIINIIIRLIIKKLSKRIYVKNVVSLIKKMKE